MGETCPLADGCGCADFIIKKTLPNSSSSSSSVVDDDDDVVEEEEEGTRERRRRRTKAPEEGGGEEEKSCIFPLGHFYGSIYPPETPGTDCDVLFAVS